MLAREAEEKFSFETICVVGFRDTGTEIFV